ncbi:MAG: protein phosphatase 2C domain-containing protein [Atopobiaceae bacterium]|nr:protein phosphatase 2C domain-containing protein [Atopobiaceae bacterium]
MCQDSAASREIEGQHGWAYVAAIADGHGDPACFRSDRGSRIAVNVALAALEVLARDYLDADDDARRDARTDLLGNDESNGIRHRLARDIVCAWRAQVMGDYADDPVPELDEALVGKEDQFREYVPLLYGTTLAAAVMLPDLSLLVQQGDGCTTVIFSDGRDPLARADVVPEDELCVGNITTSLCDTDAALRMRVVALDHAVDPVAALFVGSDGIDKSLQGADGASDLFAGVALSALDRVSAGEWDVEVMRRELREMMTRLSQSGIGDDVSLAGVVDVGALAGVAGQLTDERRRFGVAAELEACQTRLSSMRRKYEYYCALEPPTDVVAAEKEAYLAEYRELEQRVCQLQDELVASSEGGLATDAPSKDYPEDASAVASADATVDLSADALADLSADASADLSANSSVDASEWSAAADDAPHVAESPSVVAQSPSHVLAGSPQVELAPDRRKVLLIGAIAVLLAVLLCMAFALLLRGSGVEQVPSEQQAPSEQAPSEQAPSVDDAAIEAPASDGANEEVLGDGRGHWH